MNADDKIIQAAKLAVWGALRQRHYATFDEVFDTVGAEVVAAVRPLIEAEALRDAADQVYGDERYAGPHSNPLSTQRWLRSLADAKEAGR